MDVAAMYFLQPRPVPAGQRLAAPAHKNNAYEETLYGIVGTLTWTTDGKAIAVGPGQAVCILRGAVYRFDNFGTEDAKQLSIVTPAIMGPGYFREASALVTAVGHDGREDPRWGF
jgi:quercetin dioxygenase-like cupin family protein